MRSYFSYFTAEELATVKGRKRKTQLYDCVLEYAFGKNDDTASKCSSLVSLIEGYRKRSKTGTINELIADIIYNSGYYDYVGAMNGGNARKANLDMLVQKAREYEKTSYSGLFNFLRYIEKLRKYEVDYGEAQSESEEDDVVRIMSIHKSKGLEFPVVIIGNMGKEYNTEDLKKPIIYDSNYGLGITDIDLKYRIRKNSAYKNMLVRKIMSDNIGEELRLLYVAMTRAEQKLIMLGVDNLKSNMPKWQMTAKESLMNMNYISENRSYIDIVMPPALSVGSKGRFNVITVGEQELSDCAVRPVLKRAASLRNMISTISETEIDQRIYEEVGEIFDYSYPYSSVYSLRAKYSVSDLKHKAMEESELLEAKVTVPERTKPVPSFIEERKVSGTFRGNAYHKVFELLDYERAGNAEEIKKQMSEWLLAGKISSEYEQLIDCGKFEKFMGTPLGRMMKKAFEENVLFREQPFTMEVSASEIDEQYPSDENVLVQGIIDAFFFRDDKVYIVDYKTDSVPKDSYGEKILVERYKKQLELYCDAMEKITGREIGGCYIYSVSLGKEINVR